MGNWSHHGQNTRTTLKPPLKTSTYQQSEGEQISLDRAKWRGLIRWSAGEYKAKRTSEAEQKCAQRKARAKASLAELPQTSLVYLQQAKICLISHLRTHNNISRILIGNGHCP